MANPYHDANGKFCSRSGMLDSIHSLAAAGKVNEYLALKSEFDEIDKDTVIIVQDGTEQTYPPLNAEQQKAADDFDKARKFENRPRRITADDPITTEDYQPITQAEGVTGLKAPSRVRLEEERETGVVVPKTGPQTHTVKGFIKYCAYSSDSGQIVGADEAVLRAGLADIRERGYEVGWGLDLPKGAPTDIDAEVEARNILSKFKNKGEGVSSSAVGILSNWVRGEWENAVDEGTRDV